MATVLPVVHINNRKTINAIWEAMGDDDTGQAIDVSKFTDKMVHITGTLGGATIAFEGSNDGVNYDPVTQDGLNPIVAEGGYFLFENYLYIRPVTSGGSGTDLDFIVVGSALR